MLRYRTRRFLPRIKDEVSLLEFKAELKMIEIDMEELKIERDNIRVFLESRNKKVVSKGNSLFLKDELTLSSKEVKMLVKKFLNSRGLSSSYKVAKAGETIRVTKCKYKKSSRIKKEGRQPSPYDTMPYYFPNRP